MATISKHSDTSSSDVVLRSEELKEREEGVDSTNNMPGEKKRKRWKTLLDSLLLRRKRKSTTKVRQMFENLDEHHVLLIMEALYRVDQSMSTDDDRNTSTRLDDGGCGVECLHTEQQPSKKMKFQPSPEIPATISEDEAEDETMAAPNDLESILSIWSVLQRVDMVALFQDTGEEEVELMLVEEDIRDIVMDKPWAFTPEERWRVLDALSTANDSTDNEFDVLSSATSYQSYSGVSSLSGDTAYDFALPATVIFCPRSAPAVNPWAAAKRGDMKALEAIAATRDPSIWMTGKTSYFRNSQLYTKESKSESYPNFMPSLSEDAFEATPLYYACRYGVRHGGPEVVLFLLEQWPTGCVPSPILGRCIKNATDPDVLRILNGDQQFIEEVRNRALVALDDDDSAVGLSFLKSGEEEI